MDLTITKSCDRTRPRCFSLNGSMACRSQWLSPTTEVMEEPKALLTAFQHEPPPRTTSHQLRASFGTHVAGAEGRPRPLRAERRSERLDKCRGHNHTPLNAHLCSARRAFLSSSIWESGGFSPSMVPCQAGCIAAKNQQLPRGPCSAIFRRSSHPLIPAKQSSHLERFERKSSSAPSPKPGHLPVDRLQAFPEQLGAAKMVPFGIISPAKKNYSICRA